MLDGVDMRTFALPLDGYGLSAADSRAEFAAIAQVYEQCMAQFGFAVEPEPARAASGWSPNEGRYGIHDTEAARVWGYRIADDPVPEPQLPYEPPRLPADQEAVSFGIAPMVRDGKTVPPGGCSGEASRAMGRQYGRVADAASSPLMLSDLLGAETGPLSEADSRVQAAFRAWSDCMWREGFDYPDPSAANNDPSFARGPNAGDQAPSAHEVAVAVADTTCKAATDLIDIRASVEVAYQNRAIEQNAAALAIGEREAAWKRQRAAEILQS